MIRACLFPDGELPYDVRLEDWPDLRRDSDNTLWVDVEGSDEAELRRVVDLFEIHPRAVQLAGERSRAPATRFFGDQLYVGAVSVDVDETQERPRIMLVPLALLVGENFLLSLHADPLPFDHELRDRVGNNPTLGRFQSSYLLHAVLDTMVGHYAREIDEIELKVERHEETMLRAPTRGTLGQTLVLKRHIQRVRRVVAPHREAVAALVGADSPIEDDQVEQYFRDLSARLSAVIDRLDHLRDLATGSFDLYISSQTYRTNQQLRVLTFLSAILLPITAVTGVFGTNFRLNAYELTEPFYAMLAGMAVISAGMLFFFKRRGWL